MKGVLDKSSETEKPKSHVELMKEVWADNNYGSQMEQIRSYKDFRYLPSFTFVRNPIDRVISAWREKLGPLSSSDSLAEKVMFFEKMGKDIVEKYRLGGTGVNATLDMAPISLEEMFRYIDGIDNLVKLDGHFRPFSFNAECSVCSYPYQYIIKLENIYEELPFVLRRILGHDNFAHPQTPPDKQSQSKLLNYLHQVPPDLVLRVFNSVYRHDFEIFGYKLPASVEDITKN